jgi:hypothetical protein
MERELWRLVAAALKRLPRRRPRGAVYDNAAVLALLLWAALHDRSISWACRRENWPMQAWRRDLPDQSTMSRRLRDPGVLLDLTTLLHILQRTHAGVDQTLIVDGKPLAVSEFSRDGDARVGWGAGRHGLGYKLHALIDSAQKLLAFHVAPLNQAECVAACVLIDQAKERGVLPSGATLLGDASYDSNPLHAHARGAGLRLLAPRRRPDRPVCRNRRHDQGRLDAIAFTEHDPSWPHLRASTRPTIERYFGTLATVGGGLFALPAWARRSHRVRAWTAAKLVLHAARTTLRKQVAA